MDIRMLQVFVAVADEGGFTRAADRLHLVQSSVSASVKSLERQIGFPLFERRTRSVQLTAEGKSFLPHAREVVEAMAKAQDAASEMVGGVSGTVSVGVLVIPDSLGIAASVARLHERHPGIHIGVRTATGGSAALLHGIDSGELDVSFVVLPLPVAASPQTVLEPLLSGGYVLACGAQHRWASRTDDIPQSECDGVDFVEFPEGFSLRRATDELFAATPYRRRTHVEVADLQLIASYIAAGVGVGFVTRDTLRLRDDLVPLRTDWLDLRWTIAIARHRDRRVSRAAESFLEAIRENCRHAIEAGIADAPA